MHVDWFTNKVTVSATRYFEQIVYRIVRDFEACEQAGFVCMRKVAFTRK